MSSGDSNNAISVNSELAERLIEVTACTADEADHLLAACANNVEAAVALFFEQGSASGGVDAPNSNDMHSALNAPIVVDDDDDSENGGVRAPIAPIREQLVGPEDDNFFASEPQAATNPRLARVAHRVKVCPLRDFAREGALMEEQLNATGLFTSDLTVLPPNVQPRRRDRAANMVTSAFDFVNQAGTSSRLGDLFRPPTDLRFAGTFQTARTHATRRKQWLLVNVQNDSFNSQLLNRDVWSNKDLKKLVRRQFTFWQIDNDSTEGRRFIAFYHCSKLPYVCVIDPRTGEEVWRSPEPKEENMLSDLEKFLCENKDFSEESNGDVDDAPTTSKRCISKINLNDEASCPSASGSFNYPSAFKRSKITELSEEEQIAMAIKNSMHENSKVKNGLSETRTAETIDEDSDCDSIEEFGVYETKDEAASWKHISYEDQLGSAKHELTALKLRLFNAEGKDEIVQLHWPSDTQLTVLRAYIAQTHAHIPKEGGYKLICAFPRKTLESAHNSISLKDLGLHPSSNIHLTIED